VYLDLLRDVARTSPSRSRRAASFRARIPLQAVSVRKASVISARNASSPALINWTTSQRS
jgi:hypothetical protein